MHAPICEGFIAGVWGRAYSNAMAESATSAREAVEETRLAFDAARRLGVQVDGAAPRHPAADRRFRPATTNAGALAPKRGDEFAAAAAKPACGSPSK